MNLLYLKHVIWTQTNTIWLSILLHLKYFDGILNQQVEEHKHPAIPHLEAIVWQLQNKTKTKILTKRDQIPGNNLQPLPPQKKINMCHLPVIDQIQ